MNHHLKVGLFLALSLFVLLISIFMLGSNKSYFQNSYELATYFDSVQGLNNGAIVSMAGVKVGNVKAIDFDETKNLVRVDFVVDENFAKKIKKDSRIEIRTQGALGDKFLYIIPGVSSEKINPNEILTSDYGNDLLSVLSKRGSESEKIFDAIQNLNTILASIATNNKLPSLISKLDQTSSVLLQTSQNIQKLTSEEKNQKIEASLNKLDNILDKIDNGQGTLGALINDRSLHDRLKSIFGAGQKQQQMQSILKSSVEEE